MRRTAQWLLVLYTFAIPWEYSLDLGAPWGNVARVSGLALLLVAVAAALYGDKIHKFGAMQWLVLAYFLWFCLSYLWSIEPQLTLVHMRWYFQELMIVWLVWELAETPQDLRTLLKAYLAGSWVLALLTIAAFAAPGAEDQARFVAAGQDPNDVARFLDLGLPMTMLLIDGESNWLALILEVGYLPLGLIVVLLTASRGGFLAAMVALMGCGYLFVRSHRRRAFTALMSFPVIVSGAWWVVPRDTLARIGTIPEQLRSGDLNQRMSIWAAGWQAFLHAPLFGSGAGSFVSAAGLAAIDTAHNTALAIAVEGGICALLLAVAIFAVAILLLFETRGSVRIAMGTALAVWAVTSVVATVQENRTTWLLLAIVALGARLTHADPGAMNESFPDSAAARSAFLAAVPLA